MTLSSLSAFVPALGTEVEETTEAEPVRIAHFTFDSDDGGFSGDGATAISQNCYELTDDARKTLHHRCRWQGFEEYRGGDQ